MQFTATEPQKLENTQPIESTGGNALSRAGKWVGTAMQAESWVKPSDLTDIGTQGDTVYDRNFDYKKSPFYADLTNIKNKDVAAGIVAKSYNEDDFKLNVQRALKTQDASEEASTAQHIVGAVLSPETWMGASGVSMAGLDALKLAKASLATRAAIVANDARKTMGVVGAAEGVRALTDNTRTAKDAAINTMFAGAIIGGVAAYKVSSAVRHGRVLQKELDDVLAAKEHMANVDGKRKAALVEAYSAKAKVQEADNALKPILESKANPERTGTVPEAASSVKPTPHGSMSTAELKGFLGGRMKRSEYRDLYRRIDRLGEDAQVDTFAKSAAKQDADTAIERLRTLPSDAEQRLDAHLNAVQAEHHLFHRSQGMIDGIANIPAFSHSKLAQGMAKAVDFTATRHALENETAPEAIARLHDTYISQWKGIKAEYQGIHDRAMAAYEAHYDELEALKEAHQAKLNAAKKGQKVSFKNAASGLKQGKVTPFLSWSLGWASEHQRTMRSDNEHLRNFANAILNDPVHGGKSAASTKQALNEMLLKKYDAAISKPLLQFAKDSGMTVQQAAEHITDLVEGLRMPRSDAERALMAETSNAFREALDVLKAYNPEMAKRIWHKDNYVPHLADLPSIRRMMAEGTEGQYIKAMVEGITRQQGAALVQELMERGIEEAAAKAQAQEVIAKGAQGYIDKLKRLAGVGLKSEGTEARAEMAANGEFLPDIDINDLELGEHIGRTLAEDGKTPNTINRFKTRLSFHMGAEAEGVALKDLFVRDSTALVSRYQHEMTAWSGLADVGIHTPADLEARLAAITTGRPATQSRKLAAELKKAEDYVKLLKGIPLHGDTTANALIKTAMGVQFMLSLGMSFIPAMFEYGRPLAMVTTDAARHMPIVRDLARWLHRKATTEQAEAFHTDLQAISPHRHRVSSVMRHMLDPNEDATSHKLAQLVRTGAEHWGRANLMEPVDRLWRSASIDAYHQRIIRHFMEGKSQGRGISLEYIGYNETQRKDLMELMRRTAYKENGTWRVDFDKWGTLDKYRYAVAMDRAGNRFIQKGYLGDNTFERAPPLVKMLLQFRGFTMTGIGKQFVADVAAAEREGSRGYAGLAFNWLFMAMTTQLGLEARARIQYAGQADYDAKVAEATGGDNAMANMLYNHPDFGGLRTGIDMTVGTGAEWLGAREHYDDVMGVVSRTSGASNVGVTSMPVGNTLLKSVPALIKNPDAEHLQRVLPSNILTKLAFNFYTSHK